MIDGDQEMLDITGQEGMLVYSLRLVKVNASQFDSERFLARAKPIVTERACSQSEENGLLILKQGIVMRYSYVDKFEVPIGSFDVNPGDCDPGHNLSPTDKVQWKPPGAQNAQPEQQTDTQTASPWRSETTSATPSETPTTTKRAHQTVETPEMKAQALVDDGNQQLQRGNHDAAIKDFQGALALEPNNYAARSGLQEAQRMR
jgi:hypothetical protein